MDGRPARWSLCLALLLVPAAALAAGPRATRAENAAGPAGEVRALIRGLAQADPVAQAQAADELAKFGPKAAEAIPALRMAARRGTKAISGRGVGCSPGEAAARALWAIRPAEITGILEGDNRQASLNAVAALRGRTGPLACQALRLAMIDYHDDVRLAAVRAMAELTSTKGVSVPSAAVKRLGRATEDGSPEIRRAAVRALASVNDPRGAASLEETVRSCSYRDTRIEAMRLLAARTRRRGPAALRLAAKDGDTSVAAAARALLDGRQTGGVITNQSLASAGNLRPLSTITVHAAPRRADPPTDAAPGRSGGAAEPDGRSLEKLADNLPPELAGLIKSAAPALGANAGQAPKLDGMSGEQLMKALTGASGGAKQRPMSAADKALVDFVRKNARQQAAGLLGPQAKRSASAGSGAADNIQKVLQALGVVGGPSAGSKAKGRKPGASWQQMLNPTKSAGARCLRNRKARRK